MKGYVLGQTICSSQVRLMTIRNDFGISRLNPFYGRQDKIVCASLISKLVEFDQFKVRIVQFQIN